MNRTDHFGVATGHDTALVLIDLINTWEMKDGPALLRHTLSALPAISTLLDSARRHGAPVIFANDNFGRWRSNLPALVELARAADPRSARIVDALAPTATDYIVLKPAHSAFFATPLERLLEALKIRRLVLAGIAGDQCVLATASDALLRRFEVIVPRDAIACASAARRNAVLRHFATAMDIPTPASRGVRWTRHKN